LTLADLVETIRQLGGESALNTTVFIELALPRVLHKVAEDASRDENQLNALRSNHTLSVASGVVSCPGAIKEEHVESIVFLSAPTTSYSPSALDYSYGSDLFDTFRVDSGSIHYREAGEDAGTFTGVKTINAITLPSLPAASTDAVNLKDNILQKVITTTASLIKGEIPLAAFGLNDKVS
jgi:hypothetical protein